jgi:hypothetical protein
VHGNRLPVGLLRMCRRAAETVAQRRPEAAKLPQANRRQNVGASIRTLGPVRGDHAAALEAETLAFEVETFAGDAERFGGCFDLAAVFAQGHFDHLGFDLFQGERQLVGQ